MGITKERFRREKDYVHSRNTENCYGIDMNSMLIVIEKCYHLQIIN